MGPALVWGGPSVGEEPPSSCRMPTAASHTWSASPNDHLLSLSHAFSSSGPWHPLCLAYQLLRATCAEWPHVGGREMEWSSLAWLLRSSGTGELCPGNVQPIWHGLPSTWETKGASWRKGH